MKRATRDRMLVAGIGMLCIVGGVLGLLKSFGAFEGKESEPVLLEDIRAFVDRNDATFWPVVAGIALIVAYLGARWLLSELRAMRRPAPLRVTDSADAIVIDLSALAEAAESDLEREPLITAADVSVTNRVGTPSAEILIAADDAMALDDVRRTLSMGALPRLADALELDHLDARVLVTFRPATRHLA